METKNTGLNITRELSEVSAEDWVFGSASQKCIAEIPEDVRESYLPVGEVQRGQEDMQDCATRSVINILETKFNWLYKNGKLDKWFNQYLQDGKITFSDAFIAILSGTTRNGNSLIAPIKAVHKFGLIPKAILPLEKTMTFNEYHNPTRITAKMKAIGQEFLKRFNINYERVYEVKYKELLHIDLLNVAGYAWTNPVNGEYPKTNLPPNHAFILFNTPMSYAFDNYHDRVDGDFIKKLATDYDFYNHGYRIFISENTTLQRITIMQKILTLLKRILGLNKKMIEIIENSLTPSEVVYNTSKSLLGQSVITGDKTLGCAEALNAVIKKATGSPIGGTNSTHRVYQVLIKEKKFKQIYEPIKGAVIISPTGYGNGRVEHGHCGVIGDNCIHSNDSRKGYWNNHWGLKKWKAYFGFLGNFPVHYFALK